MTDTSPQPKVSRWLIATAIFGGVCNLLCVVLSRYEDYYRQYPLVWGGLVLPIAILLAPLLVLFALRRVLLVVFIYVSTFLWILVQQVHLSGGRIRIRLLLSSGHSPEFLKEIFLRWSDVRAYIRETGS